MTQSAEDLAGTFRGAWTLLWSNLIVVVPGLVLGAVAIMVVLIGFVMVGAAAVVAASNGGGALGTTGIVIAGLVVVALFMLVAIAQTAIVTGMAGKAWQTGKTTLGDGMASLSGRGGQIFYALLLMMLIGLAAVVLAPFTLLLSLLAYVVFFIYVMPSVVLGGLPAGRAVAESWRLTARNFGPTLGVVAIVICASLIGAVLGGELSRVQPVIGSLGAMAVEQAAAAYATLVIVGEYLKLHGGTVPAE